MFAEPDGDSRVCSQMPPKLKHGLGMARVFSAARRLTESSPKSPSGIESLNALRIRVAPVRLETAPLLMLPRAWVTLSGEQSTPPLSFWLERLYQPLLAL